MGTAKGILLLFFMITGSVAFCQHIQDPFHDADGNTYHQLFLDFRADELIDVRYADDTPVEGKLSADGYSVILKNYAGDKSVKVKLKLFDTSQKEVIKSRCFIDPVLLES